MSPTSASPTGLDVRTREQLEHRGRVEHRRDPVCGDGMLAGDETCDDGNLVAGDGCDENCAVERWSHVGVAHDVPVGDLHLWEPEPCWWSTYETGASVALVQPVGSDVLTLAAHAPRAAVFAEVNYDAQERSTANGVDFFWAPYYGDRLWS